MSSDRARQLAGNIDRRELAHEALTGALVPSHGTTAPAAAAAVMQQHIKNIPAVSGFAPAPAGPGELESTAANPAHRPMQAQQTSSSSTAHDTQRPAAAPNASSTAMPSTEHNPSEAGATGLVTGVPGGQLLSAGTGAGPLVTTSVEEGAQAQQVLQVLDNYDFRIYGQGLMAGADAVPLTPVNHRVMYQPTPEETVEAPLPPGFTSTNQQQQQQGTASKTAGTRPAATATAIGSTETSGKSTAAGTVAGTAAGTTKLVHTPSGTPAIPMRALPDAAVANSSTAATSSTSSTSTSSTGPSKLQGVLQAAAAVLPPAGTSAAAASRDTVQVSSPISSTTAAAQLKQQLQQQTPASVTMRPIESEYQTVGTPFSSSTAAVGGNISQGGLIKRHAKQQQGSAAAGYTSEIQSADTTTATSSSSSSSGQGRLGFIARTKQSVTGYIARTKQSVVGFWQSTKVKVVRGANWLLDEVIYAVWVVLQWVAWLLLWPFKATLGPWYQYNRHLKTDSASRLSQPYDLSTMQDMLGALPSWLSGIGGATEDLEWLNKLLAQVWPTLDPIVCELVRSSIEPLLDDMKPPIIAKMGFQRLTLGELPVVLDGIRLVGTSDQSEVTGVAPVDEAAANFAKAQAAATSDDRLEIEVDFHWDCEPNISFFVELAIAGPYTRLVPKVSNLSAQGTLRLGLTRLVPELPGFGALLISFARVPQIKFTLDFGPAMGGKLTAKPVASFLDPFLRDTLASMLVWPNRFVIPLLSREVTGNLDSLALHSVGVLEVDVLSAHDLPKQGGFLSTVDPQVELWTQPQHHVHSSVKKNRRNPKWKNQTLEVLVQEPDSQVLRVVMHDIDIFNPTELLQVNVFKGATSLLRSANPIGWASLQLRDICNKPQQRQEIKLRLAGSEWAYELGVVGEAEAGSLSLGVTYKPFMDLKADSSAPINCRGALFVTLRQCQELPAGDWDTGDADPYVLLKVAGQKSQTVVLPHTRSPIFNSHHEFFNVQLPDVLIVQVYDRDYLKPDDLLGGLELPVKTILTWTQGGVRGMRDGWWRLKHKKKETWDDATGGRIEMKIQFRPYTT